MLKAANGLVEILNGSKDPVLVHHVAVVQFLRRRRSNDEAAGRWQGRVKGLNENRRWHRVAGGNRERRDEGRGLGFRWHYQRHLHFATSCRGAKKKGVPFHPSARTARAQPWNLGFTFARAARGLLSRAYIFRASWLLPRGHPAFSIAPPPDN